MPSADQVPVKSTHSKMLWPEWVVLIAGSTGSALRAVRPPNRHITPGVGMISLRRERSGFSVPLTPRHHRPRHPGKLVGQCDGRDLGGTPRQQCGEPRPMPGTMDLGVANDGECAGRKQDAQIAITALADTAELVLAAARALLGDQPDPGREVPS